MKKALVVIAALLAVLAAVYLAGSWYFSGMIVKFQTQSLDEQRAEIGTPADFGLPTPEEVTIPADDMTLGDPVARSHRYPLRRAGVRAAVLAQGL